LVVLVTGATGLIGASVAEQLLVAEGLTNTVSWFHEHGQI
jgi:uncharacterized protein YbjT (DUF2867 family)